MIINNRHYETADKTIHKKAGVTELEVKYVNVQADLAIAYEIRTANLFKYLQICPAEEIDRIKLEITERLYG